MRLPILSPPITTLLPALAIIPSIWIVISDFHQGGLSLLSKFTSAAINPSFEESVLKSAWQGLQITLSIAMIGWTISMLIGALLGITSSKMIWKAFGYKTWPCVLIKRFLCFPRAFHEVLWGLLLLQIIGFSFWVAIIAIAIPSTCVVAKVLSNQIDVLNKNSLIAISQVGANPLSALTTSLLPKTIPTLLSYAGYQLECTIRGATLLGIFGMGGIGSEIILTLKSLNFQEMWTFLWILFGTIYLLERFISFLRNRYFLADKGAHKLIAMISTMLILSFLSLERLEQLQPHLFNSFSINAIALPETDQFRDALFTLPWINLISSTMLLTMLASGIAIGIPPLILMLWPKRIGEEVQGIFWTILRVIPPPLTAIIFMLFTTPSLALAALCLGLHNIGVMGKLLKEEVEKPNNKNQKAFQSIGAGKSISWIYGVLSQRSHKYLAYASYRTEVILKQTTILGIVGGTGLGWQLIESLSSFNWSEVMLVVIVFSLITMTIEIITEYFYDYWNESQRNMEVSFPVVN